jgi:hypothetical protein
MRAMKEGERQSGGGWRGRVSKVVRRTITLINFPDNGFSGS